MSDSCSAADTRAHGAHAVRTGRGGRRREDRVSDEAVSPNDKTFGTYTRWTGRFRRGRRRRFFPPFFVWLCHCLDRQHYHYNPFLPPPFSPVPMPPEDGCPLSRPSSAAANPGIARSKGGKNKKRESDDAIAISNSKPKVGVKHGKVVSLFLHEQVRVQKKKKIP